MFVVNASDNAFASVNAGGTPEAAGDFTVSAPAETSPVFTWPMQFPDYSTDARRIALVGVATSGAAVSLVSMTIGGVNATILQQVNSTLMVGLGYAVVPTGGTLTTVATFSSSVSAVMLSSMSLIKYLNPTAAASRGSTGSKRVSMTAVPSAVYFAINATNGFQSTSTPSATVTTVPAGLGSVGAGVGFNFGTGTGVLAGAAAVAYSPAAAASNITVDTIYGVTSSAAPLKAGLIVAFR